MNAAYCTYAYERKERHNGHITYQIDNPVKNGHQTPGVVWESTLVIVLAEPPKDHSKSASVSVWVPGVEAGKEHRLNWGEGTVIAYPVADWTAHVGVVSNDDVELRVFVRVLPGVAEG